MCWTELDPVDLALSGLKVTFCLARRTESGVRNLAPSGLLSAMHRELCVNARLGMYFD
jgi:hypothetical protein